MTSAETANIAPEMIPRLPAMDQRVLDYIRAHGGRTTGWIADHLKISYTNVSPALTRLFNAGLVFKQADENDGRKVRYFPSRVRHEPGKVNFSPDHQMKEVYTPGSEVEKTAPKNPEPKLGTLFQSTEFDTLKVALGAASSLLDKEVQKPEAYDLVLVYHLGGVITHLSKLLQRRAK